MSGAVAGILAYFTWNAMVFGGLVPVSAAAKQWLSWRRWEREGGYSLTENVHAFLRTGFFDTELLIALEVCVYVVVVWWFSRRSRGRDDRLLLAFLVGLFGLAAGHLAKFAQSVLTVNIEWGTFEWYFVPAYLLGALVVPARCCVAIWFVRRFVWPGPHRGSGGPWWAAGIPNRGIVAAGAIFLFAAVDFTAPFRFVDQRREATFRGWPVYFYLDTMVMNHVLPESSVVGAEYSGIVGYFSRFPVMNLDGLANSWDYLRARQEETDAAVHQRYGVTHYVDFWTEPPGGTDRPVWERMEPHLERWTDGVGLLVDGRLARAFVRDCTDRLAEWTWAGQKEPVRTSWRQVSAGFCTSDAVLPHGSPSSVRAAALPVGEYVAERVGGRRPAIDADFDVHVVEDRLVYVKEACGLEDVVAPFFVAVEPVDPDDLPGPRRRHGFDNLDFQFDEISDERTVRTGRVCVTEVPLPEYRIAAIRTGQVVMDEEGGYHHLWEGEIRHPLGGIASGRAGASALTGESPAARVGGRRPAIDADFDVYVVEDRLVYVKEACGPEDVAALFFVAVEPADPDDLPGPRRRYGFDNLDFRFADRGSMAGGVCAAEVPLPAYRIAAIRTGQYVAVEGGFHHPWEGEIRLDVRPGSD